MQLELPILPDRPRFGESCNGCGQCCAGQLCNAAKMAGASSLPCPYLKLSDDRSRTLCGLVDFEQKMGLEPILQKVLGIGLGCSLPDEIEVSMKRFLIERLGGPGT